jgi:hypothetical protein
MWATVMVLALLTAMEPVRIGMAMFLISGPRPMLNLLAFWIGGMATGMAGAMIVLVLLRDLASTAMQGMIAAAGSIFANSLAGHIKIGVGVVALLLAASIATGLTIRHRAPTPVLVVEPSALVPTTPTVFSRLASRTKDALGVGFPWVAFIAGLSSAGPPPVEFMFALTAILASGTAIGTQVSAAVTYMIVMLTIVELPLLCYLARPAKTEAMMLSLRDWLRARSRQILAFCVAAAGVGLVANGMGNL